jgi:hypothetical protein
MIFCVRGPPFTNSVRMSNEQLLILLCNDSENKITLKKPATRSDI